MNKWSFPQFELLEEVFPEENKENEFQKISQEAFHEGFEKGLNKGYQEGLEKGKQKVDQEFLSLHRITKEMECEKVAMIDKMEKSCFLVLKKICKHVLYKELNESEEAISSILRKSLGLIGNHDEKMKLSCAKPLFLLLENKMLDFSDTLFLEENESLENFDFIIESSTQRIDFQFDKAIERLFNYAE